MMGVAATGTGQWLPLIRVAMSHNDPMPLQQVAERAYCFQRSIPRSW
jgi:hypothetical protein